MVVIVLHLVHVAGGLGGVCLALDPLGSGLAHHCHDPGRGVDHFWERALVEWKSVE